MTPFPEASGATRLDLVVLDPPMAGMSYPPACG
jgi:hypothetical protein